MNRCSFCEWIPILPWPIWPLAGQLLLGQNVVVGSMTLLLAVRGKHCHEKYVGTPVFFTTALHHGLVWSYLLENSLKIRLNQRSLRDNVRGPQQFPSNFLQFRHLPVRAHAAAI